MTPSQVLSNIRNQLYETSNSFWSDNEILQYMWDAECDIAADLECCEKTDATTTTVASTQEYAKPSDCLIVKRLTWYSQKLKRVDFTDIDQMDFSGYGHTPTTGNPHSYYEYGDNVGLYPVPASAQTLKFWYVYSPTQLTTSSTAFSVPGLFHTLIQDYALWRCYAKDQDDGRSGLHRDQYERSFSRAKSRWMRRDQADGHFVVRDESVYPSTEQGLI